MMTETAPKTIRTEADAFAWISATDNVLPGAVDVINGVSYVVTSAACGRCGGSGYGHWTPDGGRCYECGGADTRHRVRRVSVKAWAQARKAKWNALARKAAQVEAAAAKRKAETAALAPDLDDLLTTDHPLVESLRLQAEHNGLTEKQVALLRKLKADVEAARLAAGTVPEGRREVTGRVVSTKMSEDWGYGSVLKMLVEFKVEDGTVRVFGSVPAGIRDTRGAAYDLQGALVRFTATLERSAKDADFGFFSRPSKAETLAMALTDENQRAGWIRGWDWAEAAIEAAWAKQKED